MTTPNILKTKTAKCLEHGEYKNHLIESFSGDHFWQGCTRCQFDAYHSGDDAVSKAAGIVHRERQLNLALMASGIPPRFRGATLESYLTTTNHEQQEIARRQCHGYAEGFEDHWRVGRSMMLLGAVGTGKTHLGCAVAQSVIRSFGAAALYTSALDIIRDIKSTFGKGAELSEREVYAALRAPDLLVIDEVGVQHGSDFERQVLFEVINDRYKNLDPTIVISNLSIQGLRKCLGDRAVDRLSDADGPTVLFNWASARGAA